MKRRTKKRITETVGWLALLIMLGVVRGMDLGTVRVGAGAAWAIGLEAVWAACLWKAGWIRWP